MQFNSSIFEEEAEDQGISLNTETSFRGMKEEDAKAKAIKYNIAKGNFESPKDITEVQSKFQDGDVESLETALVNKDFQEKTAERMSIIEENILDDTQLSEEVLNTPVHPVDARGIIERKYGQQTASALGSVIDMETLEGGDDVFNSLDTSERILFRAEFAKTELAKLQKEAEEQGYLSRGIDIAQTFVPFYSWAVQDDAVDLGEDDPFLPGNDLEAQLAHLYSLPEEEFIETFQNAVNSIKEFNPVEAERFASAVISYSSSDKFMDNAFGVLDIVDVATLGVVGSVAKAGVRGVAKGSKKVSKAVKDSTKAVIKHGDKDPVKVLEGVGKTEEAVTTILKDPERVISKVEDLAPSLANPASVFDESVNLKRASLERLKNTALKSAEYQLEALKGTSKISRLEGGQIDEAIRIAKDKVFYENARSEQGFLDVNRRLLEDTNTHQVDFYFGSPKTSEPFKSPTQAKWWADRQYRFAKDDYDIVQQGEEFVLKITRDVAENDTKLLEVGALNDKAILPVTHSGNGNVIANYLRSANAVTPDNIQGDKLLVQSQQQKLNELLTKSVADDFGKLTKKGSNRMNTFIRKFGNTDVEGRPGKFFDNADEMVNEWEDLFGRTPTENEVSAYFNFVRVNDLDYAFRNASIFRDKVIAGVEKKSIGQKGEIQFEGKSLDKIPESTKDHHMVAIIDPSNTKPKLVSVRDLSPEIKQAIKDGKYKVSQTFDPTSLRGPLKTTESVNFVVSPDIRSSRIDLRQIEYRPGGHKVYKNNFFVKQMRDRFSPTLRRSVYEGDNTLFAANTLKEANEISDRINEALKLLGKPEFNKYVTDNLPLSPKQFKKLIDDGVLNPKQLVKATSKNRRLIDDVKEGSKPLDVSNDVFNLKKAVEGKYTQDRDFDVPLITTKNGDMEGKPVFGVDSPNLLDATDLMSRSLNEMSKSLLYDDFLKKGVDNFFINFSDSVKGYTKEDIIRNPIAIFREAKWDNTLPNKARLQAAKAYHQKILQFMGEPTPLSKVVMDWKRNMLEDILPKTEASRVARFTASILEKNFDPFTTLRATAFHSKLGLFNPLQYALQAQTAAVSVMVSPRHGMPALMDAIRAHMTRISMDSDDFAKFVGKTTDSPDFMEGYALLKKSGFDIIGGEVAYLDDVMQNKMIQGKFGKFLDAGTTPFRYGEKYTRGTAFFTSYREMKAARKGMKITGKDLPELLRRADDLALNMTRSSNASWQQGITSVPTQFFSFQQRLLEAIFSRQFTAAESLRIVGGFGLMYGIPIGVGGSLTGLFNDTAGVYKEAMLREGIDTESGAAKHILSNGIIDYVAAQTLGQDYNIAERYGPGGFDKVSSFAQGEDTGMEVLLGASGDIGKDIAKGVVNGVFPALHNILYDEDFEPSFDDWKDALKQVSTLNNADRMLAIVNDGVLLDSRGNVLTDNPTTMDAIASGVFGLTPQEISDSYIKSRILYKDAEWRRGGEKLIIKEFNKSVRNSSEGIDNSAQIKRIRAYKKYYKLTDKEISSLFRRAMRGDNETRLEKTNQRFEKLRERN